MNLTIFDTVVLQKGSAMQGSVRTQTPPWQSCQTSGMLIP
jgi:hypothetical protein